MSETTRTLDDGIAFAFTTVNGHHEVMGRFMTREELRRSAGTRKTRVYVALGAEDMPANRPPISIRGEDPDNDRAWDAYNRLEVRAMRAMVERVTPALEVAGEVSGWAKFSFSRKAGCGCGCSPGFIMDGRIRCQQERPYWDQTFATPVEVWVR